MGVLIDSLQDLVGQLVKQKKEDCVIKDGKQPDSPNSPGNLSKLVSPKAMTSSSAQLFLLHRKLAVLADAATVEESEPASDNGSNTFKTDDEKDSATKLAVSIECVSQLEELERQEQQAKSKSPELM